MLASSISKLAEKVMELLRLVPQLSLPYTVVGLIDLILDTLQKARAQLLHLRQRMQQFQRAVDRAEELGDAGLLAIARCAQENVAQEAANTGKALGGLSQLVALLNVFLGMVGAPEVPDLSSLSGRPLDEAIAPLDAIVEALQAVRRAVPLP